MIAADYTGQIAKLRAHVQQEVASSVIGIHKHEIVKPLTDIPAQYAAGKLAEQLYDFLKSAGEQTQASSTTAEAEEGAEKAKPKQGPKQKVKPLKDLSVRGGKADSSDHARHREAEGSGDPDQTSLRGGKADAAIHNTQDKTTDHADIPLPVRKPEAYGPPMPEHLKTTATPSQGGTSAANASPTKAQTTARALKAGFEEADALAAAHPTVAKYGLPAVMIGGKAAMGAVAGFAAGPVGSIFGFVGGAVIGIVNEITGMLVGEVAAAELGPHVKAGIEASAIQIQAQSPELTHEEATILALAAATGVTGLALGASGFKQALKLYKEMKLSKLDKVDILPDYTAIKFLPDTEKMVAVHKLKSLDHHEGGGHGGHALDRHVSKEHHYLEDRLQDPSKYDPAQKHIRAATSYPDKATAERIVQETIAANEKEFLAWAKDPKIQKPLPLSYKSDKALGYGVSHDNPIMHDYHNAQTVFVKNQNGKIFIKTSYPKD